MRDSIKYVVIVICLFAIGIGFKIAATPPRRQEQVPYVEGLDRLHKTDLHALYNQMNLESFGGQLRSDVTIFWANLRTNPSCGNCAAMTDYGNGRPRIRFDDERVQSENSLHLLMGHEMCHLATNEEVKKSTEDAHGPLWQECMRRFEVVHE
jgi:SprT-like family